MKFRHKLTYVDAVRFNGENADDVIKWGGEDSVHKTDHPDQLEVETWDGVREVIEGDWIVRELDNNLYPFHPDSFHNIYELTPETEIIFDATEAKF